MTKRIHIESIITRTLIVLITTLLYSFSLNAQVVNISISNPKGVNVCDTSVVTQIEIINITNASLTGGKISINFPTGIEYEPSYPNSAITIWQRRQ